MQMNVYHCVVISSCASGFRILAPWAPPSECRALCLLGILSGEAGMLEVAPAQLSALVETYPGSLAETCPGESLEM